MGAIKKREISPEERALLEERKRDAAQEKKALKSLEELAKRAKAKGALVEDDETTPTP